MSTLTATTSHTLFHALPVDVVRAILEWAAFACRRTSYMLIRVSKAVNHWILPLLYRKVVLESTASLLLFREAVSTLKSRPGDYTTVLYLPHSQHPMMIASFLAYFPALNHLTISSALLNHPTLNSNDRSPRGPFPSSVTITGSLARVVFDQPLFRRCTHLYFTDDIPAPYFFTLDLFPKLTHLACSYRHGRTSTVAFTCLPLLLLSHMNHSPTEFSQNESDLPPQPPSRYCHVELEVLIVEIYMSNGSPDATGFLLERLGLGLPAHQRRMCSDPRLFLRPGEPLTPRRWEHDIVNKVMWTTVEQHIESRR